MRQVLIRLLVITTLFLMSVGCNNKKTFLRKDFIVELEEKLKINNALKFNIIEKNDNLNEILRKDFMLYCLVNFINSPNKITKKENFDDHLKIAKELNLNLDERNFDSVIYKKDLEKYFLKALEIKNNKKFENNYNVKFKKEIKEILNPKIDGDKLYGNYDGYEYVSYKFDNEIIVKKIEKKDGYYLLKEVELNEIIDEMDIEGEFELNFENSVIVPLNEVNVKNRFIKNDNLEEISFNKLQNTFNIQDYEIGYRFSKDSLNVNVSNNTKNGIFFAEFNIFSIKPQIKLKKDFKTSYNYLKLGFNTSEHFGFKRRNYKRLYGDFSNFKGDDLLEKLSNSFKKEKDVIEKQIPLFDLKVPIPNLPLLNLYLRFGINIYTSGRVELNFNTKHLVGFENHNDGIRIVNDFEKDIDVLANASASSTINISLGVSSLGKRLADLRVDSGIKGEINNTLHLYDDLNNDLQIKSQMPADYLVETLNGNSEVKVCSELSLFWVLKLAFNSSGTLLNDLGITRTIDIFKDEQQVLKNKLYLENLQVVEKCNIKRNLITKKEKNKTDSNKITLKTYHKAIKIDEEYKIEIIDLPKEYTFEDLRFEVNNKDIAEVKTNGIVKALKSGVCIVRIYTNDHKYNQSINILVKSRR